MGASARGTGCGAGQRLSRARLPWARSARARLSQDRAARAGAARGMTLIDVLVALCLITLGSAGFLAMQLIVLRANEAARQLSEATNQARVQMEQVLYTTTAPASGQDTVDAFGCRTAQACTQRGVIFTRTWTVVAGAPTRVQVRVAWVDGGGQAHAVVLDGLR